MWEILLDSGIKTAYVGPDLLLLWTQTALGKGENVSVIMWIRTAPL